MPQREINFDRFVRWILAVLGLVVVYFSLSYLSPVLIPFFVAWVFAYMLYPIVRFFEVKCRLRYRVPCIILTLALVGVFIMGIYLLVVPPFVEETSKMKEVVTNYVQGELKHEDSLPSNVNRFLQHNLSEKEVEKLLQHQDVQTAIKKLVPKALDVVSTTAGMLIGFISSLIGLLYFFFLLMDYEKYANGWIRFVPPSRRKLTSQIVDDIERGMNGYFRGQVLVALSNCVMFSVGFLLIGFPMPIALGCFIGLISFVPYLQLIGLVPATLLALMSAAQTGQNFWLLFGGVVLVYCVVQVLQDVFVTPAVMGKIMGLSPAVVLLSLSVWGYMLGIIGLIIALPMTTLMISYYRRYICGETEDGPMEAAEEG